MLNSIELRNVRTFEGDGWSFPLAPLTVLCGTNSAGKSTIFKSILLFMQSQTAASSAISERTDGRLSFIGSFADLGSYRSFVSHNDVTRDIGIGFETSDPMPRDIFRRLITKGGSEAVHTELEAGDDVDSLVTYTLSSHFSFSERPISHDETAQSEHPATSMQPENIEPQLSLEGIPKPDRTLRVPVLASALFVLSAEGHSLLEWAVALDSVRVLRGKIYAEYKMTVPDWYFRTTGLGGLERESLTEEKLVRFDVWLNGLLPVIVAGKFKSKKKKSQRDMQRSFLPLPSEIANPVRALFESLTSAHYIGPLRAPAKRYYITNVESDPSIDAAGEFLPYVLKYRGSDLTRCRTPYDAPGGKPRPLRVVLDEWVHYLRTGDKSFSAANCREVSIHSQGEVLSEFMMKSLDGEESFALADSGFGYSQVLPILVRGLIARAGETIIIEQPELHLNPALQVRLAEFFVALVRSGRQLLLETHSEHIVNALRVLAAEDSTGQLWRKSSILFIDTIEGRPFVKQLRIAANGTVPEWPNSFFGEAMNLSTRLLLAQSTNSGEKLPTK